MKILYWWTSKIFYIYIQHTTHQWRVMVPLLVASVRSFTENWLGGCWRWPGSGQPPPPSRSCIHHNAQCAHLTSAQHNTTQIHNHQPSSHQHSNQTLIQSCHYCNPHLHLVSTVNTSHHFLQWLTSYIQFYFFYFHYFSWNIKHYIMNWILPRDVSSSFII